MTFKTLIFEREDELAIVTFDRPGQLNSLSTQFLEDLNKVIDEAERNDEIRVLIITGKGKAFCAGADLSEAETFSSAWDDRSFLRKVQITFTRFERMSKPVIACVNGLALGGGCELALACDLRIASETARFGVPEVKVGVIPGAGGTQRLPRTVGITKALEMLFTGDPITAEEAYRVGLVNKVVPADVLMVEAGKMAKSLAEKAPLALKMAKVAAITGLNIDLDSGLLLELQCLGFLFNTEDRKEGMKAFLEKRKPQFKGK